MDNKENTINEIKELLQKLESSTESTKNLIIEETKSDQVKKENKKIVILKIVFRALIVSVVTFSFGFIIFTFLNKDKVIENKEKIENVTVDSTEIKNNISINDDIIKKEALLKAIDSLNIEFVKEITGKGNNKNAGYGPNAKAIELEIDSLRNAFKKIK